jgi:WD and tetratricopeptide repeat-containing protein 1
LVDNDSHVCCAAGTLLASGSDDTRICLWDLSSSSPVVTQPTGHKANIFCVKFMPGTGGNFMAAGSENFTIY